MSILDTICADARVRASQLDISKLRELAAGMDPAPSFRAALAGAGLGVIAEVKRRSPSKGELNAQLDPVAQARRYAEGGAAAISVLTEPHHFTGSNADLSEVAGAVDVPLLRKDFIVASAQVWEARVIGASAVLLIVAALTPDELSSFLHEASLAGLDALVEVHTGDEATVALDCGAEIVGVNNRNLATFEVDLATSESLAPRLAGCEVTVAESGVATPADATRMRDAGYDAVLVGEALVRSDDPAGLIREMTA